MWPKILVSSFLMLLITAPASAAYDFKKCDHIMLMLDNRLSELSTYVNIGKAPPNKTGQRRNIQDAINDYRAEKNALARAASNWAIIYEAKCKD